nr:glycoside hydrolase family protein [uncultured Sphingobacterium sp.]
MKKVLLITLMMALFGALFAQKVSKGLPSDKGESTKLPYTKMALTAKLMDTAVSDPKWFNWCISPIMGKDGKVHIFEARWPAEQGDEGWKGRDAEIAHFVGERPEGPFTYVNTVLKTSDFPNPAKMWAPHNPRVSYVDGKYILLYIYQTKENDHIMHTGMMIADDLNGPWKFAGKHDGMMVKNSTDPKHWTYQGVTGTENPTFMKIGKKYYIYFKSGTPTQRKARYGYAVADQLEGPYTMSEQPITDNIDYIEDAVAFHADGNYYLLTTDNYGTNTGVFGDLILWKSKTGLSFKLADAKIGMGTILDYWGTPADHKKLLGTPGHYEHSSSGKLERPAVLLIDGKPAYFYSTAGLNISGGKFSENYVFKIDWNKGN